MTKCIKIIDAMPQADQDALLTRLDNYQAVGMIPKQAQVEAAKETLRQIEAEMPAVQQSARTHLGFYSALAEGIESIATRQQPAGGWLAQIKGLVNKGAVKQDEVEWSGLTDWLGLQTGKVTRDQIKAYLDANGVQVQETVLQDPLNPYEYNVYERVFGRRVLLETFRSEEEALDYLDSIDDGSGNQFYEENANPEKYAEQGQTKYEQYTLPGGQNYREVLLTLPNAKEAERKKRLSEIADAMDTTKDRTEYEALRNERTALAEQQSGQYKSPHWDQPNVLAHMRVDDRVDSDGAKVLFVHELQSDWGQIGRKEGFAKDTTGWTAKSLAKPEQTFGHWDVFDANGERVTSIVGGSVTDSTYAIRKAAEGVPTAPFVTNTKGWLNLALKRAITMAVQGGYDKVAFANGQQNTNLYWGQPVIVGAIGRWNEVTKPEGIGKLSKNVLGRKMASLMPLDHVDAGMLPMLKHDQVLKDIVSRVPVNVVNMLSSYGISPEQLLRNGDVVFDRLPVNDRGRAATAIGSAIGESATAIRAKLRGLSSGGSDIKILPALSASDLSPRDVAGILDPIRLFHGGTSDGAKMLASAGPVTEPLSGGKGRTGAGEVSAAELTGFLNNHAQIIHGREGLLQQGFEAPPSEGMRAFYDKIIPNTVNALLKKLGGGKVEPVSMGKASKYRAVQSDSDGGGEVVTVGGGSVSFHDTAEEARAEARRLNGGDLGTTLLEQPGFSITPAMRDKVNTGIPLFSKRDTEAAEAAGFDTSVTYYHGTTAKDFKSFRQGKGGVNELGSGIYFTSNPMYAEAWMGRQDMGGRMIPVYLKKGDIFDLGAKRDLLALARRIKAMNPVTDVERQAKQIRDEKHVTEWTPEESRIVNDASMELWRSWLLESDADLAENISRGDLNVWLARAGYIGAKNSNSQIPGQVVVFDAKNIRSPWAKFNPKKADSANLLHSRRDIEVEMDGRNTAVAKVGKKTVGRAHAWLDSNDNFVIMNTEVLPGYRRRGIDFEAALKKSQRDQTDTPEFKAWSQGLDLVESGEEYAGGPAVFVAYHGTTHSDITEFKREGLSEGFLGKGPYFTTDPEDASENYAGIGPDLTSRIEREKENLTNNDDPQSQADLLRDYFESEPGELAFYIKANQPDFDAESWDNDVDAIDLLWQRFAEPAAERAATKAVKGDTDGLMMKAYVRLSNPADTTGNSPDLTYERVEDENGTITDETGTAVDWVLAARDVGERYNIGSSMEKHIDDVLGDGGAVNMKTVFDSVRKRLNEAYDDQGEMMSAGAIFAEIAEEAGYDGVIMDAGLHFGPRKGSGGVAIKGMNGVKKGTLHMVPFSATQVKSATGNSGAFDPANPDIRKSQRDQTKTAAFKKWFGLSKVVDKDGRPLVVYHGTKGSFPEFDFGDALTGAWFTASPEDASSYAEQQGDGGNIMPVYITITRPTTQKALFDLAEKEGIDWKNDAGFYAWVRARYDGFIENKKGMATQYIPFSPTQIKSAIGNNGNWDGTNPDIRKSQRDNQQTLNEEKKGTFYADLRRRLAEHGPDAYSDRELVSAFEGGKQVPGAFYAGGVGPSPEGQPRTDVDSDPRGAGLDGKFAKVKRVGKLLSRSTGDAGHSAVIRWERGPDYLSEYVTVGLGVRQGGAPGFLWMAIPSSLVNGSPTLPELHQAYLDGNYATAIQAQPKDNGDWSVGIPGPRVGSAAYKQLKDHVELTGRFDGDGREYTRLAVGPTVLMEWQREAVRRLAMRNDGVVPNFVFDRETGSNPGRKGFGMTPERAELRFSARDSTLDEPSYSLRPEASYYDDLLYKWQDKHIDTKRVVDAIKTRVGQLADALNVYLQEELFHGRAAKRVKDFGAQEIKPLMEQIASDGYTQADVEEYLQARHAEEANQIIAQRNPNEPGLQDGGSGMTTAVAKAYLAGLSAQDAQKLAGIAAQVDAIIRQTRQLYVDYNLESQDTVDAWAQMFQHYIPLQREDKEGRMGIGQGFSVKGKETKGRTGSTRKVVDVLANIALQREKLIVRGEKNRVATALVGLATANPDPDLWSVGPPPSTRVYDPKTNTVVERVDPMYKSRAEVLVAKVPDANGFIKEVAVVFNQEDPRALRMVMALKNMDASSLEGVLAVSAKITRYFSAVNTQYNPVFGVVNLIRDVQGAMINLGETPLAGRRIEIAKNTLSALVGIYADMRSERSGTMGASPWAQLFEEFELEGGQTGFRDLFKTSADRADALQKILTPDAWMDSRLGKIFTVNGKLKVPMSEARKGAGWIFDWLSDYNGAMENAVRLSAYKAAKDIGMSKEQAASLAKNLTVNFNRKGAAGQQAGALYAFFNAAMQGTARMGQTLFTMEPGKPNTTRLSSTGKRIVYGGILLGAIQALALAASGFDDKDPPEFLRERSLILPTRWSGIGPKKGYVSIPMPLGFHVIPGIGRHAAEFALSGFEKPQKRAISMISMFMDAFNPIGNAGLSGQTFAPTAFDPFVALWENKDWTGKPIARTSSNKAVPGHTQFKDTATAPAKWIAEAINLITGGNDYVAGVMSPTPDQIDYLFGQVTGGVGRELSKVEQTVKSLVTGEELPIFKIPLAGRFYGNADSQASQASAFYDNVDKLNELETEVKGMRKDGKAAEAVALIRSRPDAYMIQRANVAERQVQRLRREKRELIKNGADRSVVKAKEAQITETMRRLNAAMAQ